METARALFVRRDGDLAVVAGFYSRVEDAGVVISIVGEAGIGKSAFPRASSERAVELGF